jgi:hypothetical protein
VPPVRTTAVRAEIDEDDDAMQVRETMTAETIRRKSLPTVLGVCADCGQPVTREQEHFRLVSGARHALCFYDPGYAQRVRELGLRAVR